MVYLNHFIPLSACFSGNRFSGRCAHHPLHWYRIIYLFEIGKPSLGQFYDLYIVYRKLDDFDNRFSYPRLALGIVTTEVDHTIMIYRDITAMGRFPMEMYKEPIRGFFTLSSPSAS